MVGDGAAGETAAPGVQVPRPARPHKRAKSDAELLGGAGVYEDRIADTLALT